MKTERKKINLYLPFEFVRNGFKSNCEKQTIFIVDDNILKPPISLFTIFSYQSITSISILLIKITM